MRHRSTPKNLDNTDRRRLEKLALSTPKNLGYSNVFRHLQA